MFERQAAGAVDVAGDDECGDLDELALTSSGRASLLLGVGDVVGGGGLVAATCRQHGEEGVLDGEVGHGVSVRGAADAEAELPLKMVGVPSVPCASGCSAHSRCSMTTATRSPIAGAKLRALLAVLALHVGRVVAAEQLVDALWGEDPPAAVRNGLQGLASKLRRALGSADLVVMRGDGYVLDLPPDAIDVERFERRAADGRALAATGELERAVEVLAEADSLWRGDPLAEFAYDDFAASAITRLSESRLALLEERLDLELQLGRHQRAVVQLEQLVADHPLREGLRGLLMLALYRAGRQADALRVFQEGRRLLVEELGLEPGPELRRLESAILAQDPSLTLPTGSAPASADAGGAGSHPMIPEALTPLVGRDAELRELRELFAEQRFVTLVGPGGVGKTRLALEVGRAAADGAQLRRVPGRAGARR